jgi:phosphatidylinositol alpha 1,6-mannosyltransferase
VLQGEELSRVYATLDVFVHTGRHETYCQSAQEALASGVPVVAPRAGGLIDVVADGAGFLYQPGNRTELAAYVARLVDDPQLRAAMAETAHRSVQGRSWPAVNERLVEHYREVSGSRAGLGLRRRVG